MKDTFGRELSIGDKVYWFYRNSFRDKAGRSAVEAIEATIVGFTEKKVKITYCHPFGERLVPATVNPDKLIKDRYQEGYDHGAEDVR